MNTTLSDGVLKTDRLGRVKTKRERREALLDEHERSGMSGQAFAGHYGLKYQTFATWVQKRRREREREGRGAGYEAGSLHLLEAVIERGSNCAGRAVLRVELPGGGASVEVSDCEQAALAGQLLRAYWEPGKPC